MDVKISLEQIAKTAKEVFRLPISTDNISIYVEDRMTHDSEIFNSVQAEIIGKDLLEGKITFKHDVEEFMRAGGYHQIGIDKDGKAIHDITILTRDGLPDYTQAYDFLETLTHEIGHAVMYEHMENNFFEKRMLNKFATANGSLNNLYRQLRSLLTEEEKQLQMTRPRIKDKGTLMMNEFERKCTHHGLISELYNEKTLVETLTLLELFQVMDAQERKMIKEDMEELENLKVENPSYFDEYQARRYARQKDRLNKVNNEILAQAKEIESIKKEISAKNTQEARLSQISYLKKEIRGALKDVIKLTPKYLKYVNRRHTLQETEGWAVYFGNKIMERFVQTSLKEAYPEHAQDLIDLHKERTDFWMNREDAYGMGFKKYSDLKSDEEVVKALDFK